MAFALMTTLPRLVPVGMLQQLAGAGVDTLRGLVSRAHPLPEVPGCTLGLLRDPYRFVLRTGARLGTDAFIGRLLFRRTVFLMGEEAAALLYNAELFQRQGATPLRLQRSLFGVGGIQSLDGREHRRRKTLFMDLVAAPGQVHRLADLAASELRAQARTWPRGGEVDFHAEMRRVLVRSVCAWAGLPLEADEEDARCEQLGALFDPAHLFGPPYWRSWWMRRRAERWCARLVMEVRAGSRAAPADSALRLVSDYVDSGGALLSPRAAAVELLNVLRPVVAVSVYAVFIALALEDHPAYRQRLADDEQLLPVFVQEVRRFYPFFPMVAARTRQAFEWQGLRFPAGVRVMLDLYATHHDVRRWEGPDVFHPERFFRREPGAYALVPQGAGDAWMHHRCPGESLTLILMQDVTRFLVRELDYRLASPRALQWSRLPPLPRHALLLADVRLAAAALPAPTRKSARAAKTRAH